MREGPGSVYNRWNISVVICDTDITYRSKGYHRYRYLEMDSEGWLRTKYSEKKR
jgi:hypothetical protein